jgi:hypothetical protein
MHIKTVVCCFRTNLIPNVYGRFIYRYGPDWPDPDMQIWTGLVRSGYADMDRIGRIRICRYGPDWPDPDMQIWTGLVGSGFADMDRIGRIWMSGPIQIPCTYLSFLKYREPPLSYCRF